MAVQCPKCQSTNTVCVIKQTRSPLRHHRLFFCSKCAIRFSRTDTTVKAVSGTLRIISQFWV